MTSRPTLAAKTAAIPPERRTKAAAKVVGSSPAPAEHSTRTVTIHRDEGAVVRWALFGTAAIIFSLAVLLIAYRGQSNYPCSAVISAIHGR